MRDSPQGILGSCTRSSKALARWVELLGCRRCRRRRQLVFHRGAIAPPGARTPHPAYLARRRVIRMLGPIPECLVLQYFKIHESYQNAWSLSISRFTGHTRMLGPSVFQIHRASKRLALRYSQIHWSKNQVWGPEMHFLGLILSSKQLLNTF